MTLRAIAYASEAASDLTAARIDRLVVDASQFNSTAGVTGVLLFDGRRFLQYIEGPEDGLRIAYDRILAARSHHSIVELQHGLIDRRLIHYWTMRRLSVDDATIRRLAASDWTCFIRRRRGQMPTATAVDQLTSLVGMYVRVA